MVVTVAFWEVYTVGKAASPSCGHGLLPDIQLDTVPEFTQRVTTLRSYFMQKGEQIISF
jgi:hypothetical protein